jgi:hypothetical protein
MSEVQERNQVKNEVALNVQEISSGLPLLSMTRKSLSLMKISRHKGLYARRQGGG